MTTRIRRLATTLAFALGLGLFSIGCTGTMTELPGDDTGGGDAPPPPGNDGQAKFNSDVKPALTGCAGCHQGASSVGPAFLGTAGESGYYAALIGGTAVNLATPASSVLLTHVHGNTAYPEFTADQKAKVQAWIELEATP